MDINHPLLFTDHINGLINNFAVFPKGNNMFGIIHGDLNPSNIHYSKSQGFTFFDFDHCAFGWRIHDLSVIKLCFPKDIFETVLEGYTSIRPLQKVEINSIQVYSDILLIRKFKDILDMSAFGNNSDEKRKFISDAVDTILSFQN